MSAYAAAKKQNTWFTGAEHTKPKTDHKTAGKETALRKGVLFLGFGMLL